MSTTLNLSQANLENVREFFLASAPNDRIGARKNGDGIELYHRDGLKGMEWLKDIFISAKTRQSNYEAAKDLISKMTDNKGQYDEWSDKSSEAPQALAHILGQHKQNFHARDFIELNNQVKARHNAFAGLEQALSHDLKMNEVDSSALKRAIGRIQSSDFAEAFCSPSASNSQKKNIENAFDHFKNFIRATRDDINSNRLIDFVAVLDLAKELGPAPEEKNSANTPENESFDKDLRMPLRAVFSRIASPWESAAEKEDISALHQKTLKEMQANSVALKLLQLDGKHLSTLGSENEEEHAQNLDHQNKLRHGITALRTLNYGKDEDKAKVDKNAIKALEDQIKLVLSLESTKILVEDPRLSAAQNIKSLCAHLDIPYPYE